MPGNKPVAFRMPCCDSLNTLSPRFFAEIFNKTTAKGNFLAIDSSVFNVFTAERPGRCRASWCWTPTARSTSASTCRWTASFVNTIEDYPYPYVIGRLCWEFPCVTPSDWQAQHLHKPNNPITVRDWKAALDATVIKQGVFYLVFHPHGWIRPEQIVELIDHARREARQEGEVPDVQARPGAAGQEPAGRPPATRSDGRQDNGVRLLDLNNDGYMDAVVANRPTQMTRMWQPTEGKWNEGEFPVSISEHVKDGRRTSSTKPGSAI